MAQKKRRARASPERGDADALSSFLASVDRFTESISAQSAGAAAEGEQKLVVQTTGDLLAAQTRKLTDYVRQTAVRIAPAQRGELEQFLRVQDGDAIASRAIEVSAKVLSPGGGPVTMGFFSFLTEHMHALKKILRGIIKILFHLFNSDPPKWIDDVSDH